jgi:hypothetical protein
MIDANKVLNPPTDKKRQKNGEARNKEERERERSDYE